MDCKACRNEIEETAMGEEARAETRAHLEECARCRAFRDERRALRELVSSLGTTPAPQDFDWKLRARLAAEKSGAHRQRLRRGFAPGLPAIAVAASFALLIAAAVFFKQADQRLNPTPQVEMAGKPATNEVGIPGDDSDKPSALADGRRDGSETINNTKSSTVNRLREGRATQVKSSRVGRESPALAAATRRLPLHANDFSSSAAPVITLFSVPVRAPSQPVKVLLDEGRGGLRTVALQPVTFGSQRILERGGGVANGLGVTAEEIW